MSLLPRSQLNCSQGGPLSPLLSNLVLDELDRELERHGHRFGRYADQCNIYGRSLRAARALDPKLSQPGGVRKPLEECSLAGFRAMHAATEIGGGNACRHNYNYYEDDQSS